MMRSFYIVPDGALSNLAQYSHRELAGQTGQIIFDWIGLGFTLSLLKGAALPSTAGVTL